MAGVPVDVGASSPEPGVAGVDVRLASVALKVMHGGVLGPAAPGINNGLVASTAAQAAGAQP